MTDDVLDPRFENDLRTVLQRQAATDVPQTLRSFVSAVPQRERPLSVTHPILTRFAALAAAAVIVIAALGTVFVLSRNSPPGPIAVPTLTPQPSPMATSSSDAHTVAFRILSGDNPVTQVDEQTIAEVISRRTQVILLVPSDVTFPDPFKGIVSVAPRGGAEIDSALAKTLAMRGEVEFIPLGSRQDVQPGESPDPALTPLFSSDGNIQSVTYSVDGTTGQPALEIDFGPTASAALAAWTSSNVGKQLAIVVDGTIALAPVMQSPITSGQVAITVGEPETDAIRQLEAVLSSGPLPYPLELLPETRASPGA